MPKFSTPEEAQAAMRAASLALVVASEVRSANEIVGAALCHLFGFMSPPDQGVVLNKASVIQHRASDFALLEIGISISHNPLSR